MRHLWIGILLSAAGLTATAAAEETVVWQLGVFDHSPAEFRGRNNAAQVTVDPSAPDAVSEWPVMQMGSRNQKAAGRVQTRTVRFTLRAEPRGAYSLDLSVLLAFPRTPKLLLKLNGTAGVICLNRKLSYVSDWRMHSPSGGEARERIPIPAGLLHAGVNELEITAVDDVADANGDSILAWDALRMLNDSTSDAQQEPEIAVEPTEFYTAKERSLHELVAVTVTLPEVVSNGELKLALGGAEFTKPLPPSQFGRQRFEFAVPEFTKNAVAKVSVSVNGRAFQRDVRVSPKRKFTVYLVPHMHLDIGFTDFQPKVLEVQFLSIDRLLAEMRREPDMRFSLDGALVAEEYLRSRTPQAKQEFLRQVTAHKITIPAQYAILMGGGASLETLIRATTRGFALNRQAGIRVEYANSTDVPAFPWGYASILHGLGLKYFAAAGNSDRGGLPIFGRWQTKSPFWWEGPDGGKVLMAYTWQYAHLWWVGGLPPDPTAFRQSLPVYLEPFEEPSYQLDTILMYGSQAENTYLVPGEAEFARQLFVEDARDRAAPRLDAQAIEGVFDGVPYGQIPRDRRRPRLPLHFIHAETHGRHMRGEKAHTSAASGGRVTRVRKTEWGQVLTYMASAQQAPSIETDIMLFDGEKKIEFVNRIRKEPSDNKEAVYFVFPFAIAQPEFSYEGQVGFVNPARDELKGGCREWYAVRHWARVQGGGASAAVIPLDTPLMTFGDINRGLWPQEFQPKSATIFSYPLNNYWHTNFQRVQQGAFTFRYVVTSGAQLGESALGRLGRDAMMPLEAGELTRFDKAENPDRPLAPVPTSFLSVDGDHVELEAFKPAEDGNGYVLRLLETAGRAGTVRIGSPLLRFESAWLCNAAEENARSLATGRNTIEVPMKPFSIVTVRTRMSLMRK